MHLGPFTTTETLLALSRLKLALRLYQRPWLDKQAAPFIAAAGPSATSRLNAGSISGCASVLWPKCRLSGIRVTPRPAATIIWIQSSRSLR